MAKNQAVFTKDIANKKINVVRTFDAPLAQVWRAWTTAELLDQWWAPRPYKAETKTMDFREGGMWLYCMAGPTGDRHWCRVDFTTIDVSKNFTCSSMFCDEEGNVSPVMPKMHWNNHFSETGGVTTANIDITFDKIEDIETMIKMGFEGGFNMGLGNLDELLGAK